jgi:SAM-dependent methyltransferase
MRLHTIRSMVRLLPFHRVGTCNVCGRPSVFICTDLAGARGSLFCVWCRSISRNRAIAQTVLRVLRADASSLSKLQMVSAAIYNADQGDVIGAYLGRQDHYAASAYLPGVPLGSQIGNGATCQDLERLTYADESFDIVITQDVLEHVRDARTAMREIHRVLRPGGYHIFTVPTRGPRFFEEESLLRVDTTGPEDIQLVDPEYHGDSIRGRILTYRNFGLDLISDLRAGGFDTQLVVSRLADERWGICNSYVFVARRRRDRVDALREAP